MIVSIITATLSIFGEIRTTTTVQKIHCGYYQPPRLPLLRPFSSFFFFFLFSHSFFSKFVVPNIRSMKREREEDRYTMINDNDGDDGDSDDVGILSITDTAGAGQNGLIVDEDEDQEDQMHENKSTDSRMRDANKQTVQKGKNEGSPRPLLPPPKRADSQGFRSCFWTGYKNLL